MARNARQHVDLECVDVLVLVDADVIDLGRELRTEPVVGGRRAPVEKEVVEIDETERALAAHVGAADRSDGLELFRGTTVRARR